MLNIEKSHPIHRGSDNKTIYLKDSITGQKLASSKLLGLLYRWLAKNYNQIIKLCKLTLSCYLLSRTALTYSLIKFCDFKIRSVDFFTQFFTTSGLDYTDLGWVLNQNIQFNKPRRPCPLGCGSNRAEEKTGITNFFNGLLGLQMPKDAS